MLILFILGAAVVFALQNVAIITVTFFSWELTGSMALILMVSIGIGVTVATFMLLPEYISNYLNNKRLRKEIARLEDELAKQKELTVFANHTPPTKEDIAKIERGAIHHNT